MNASDEKLIKGCRKGNRISQNQLYQKYKSILYGVSLRYASSKEEAEDMLQEGFIKIFSDLYQYRPTGALGAWMRKVVVNIALQHIRKRKGFVSFVDTNSIAEVYEPEIEIFETRREEELLKMIQQLPDGYRVIFNLYVMEGYNHAEIAKHLGISVSTSKSQFSRAKASLRSMIEKNMSTEL